MTKAAIPEDLFIHEFTTIGATKLAERYGLTKRGVDYRRRRIEEKLKRPLQPPITDNPSHGLVSQRYAQYSPRIPEKLTLSIVDGVVIVGGDPHYWPGPAPVMHRAFVYFLNRYRMGHYGAFLRAVLLNGDILDLTTMSRFPRDDWAPRPTVKDEIDTGIMRLGEIEEAAGHAHKLMPWGNHDARFDRFIAGRVPDLEGIKYTALEDHFSLWQICKGVDINDGYNLTYITHAYRGGEGATLNNVRRAGCHVITNHLHSANVRAVTFHNGRTLYGVDTGCLADTYGPQFGYLNGTPRDWRSAFCILTYKNSKLLQPELVVGWDENHVQFRGEILKV